MTNITMTLSILNLVQEIHARRSDQREWGNKRVANSVADNLNVNIEDKD